MPARPAIMAIAACAVLACAGPQGTRASTTGGTSSARASASAGSPAGAHGRGDPLVWRVESSGHVSYLLGTIHLGATLDATLGTEGAAALERARNVYVELDLTQLPDSSMMQQELLRTGVMRDGQSLRVLLGAELWPRFVALLPGLPPEALERFEPWVGTMMVLSAIVAGPPPGRSSPPAAGENAPPANASAAATPSGAVPAHAEPMDLTVARRAHARGAPVLELDSIREQLDVLRSGTRESSLAMLREFIQAPAHVRRGLDALISAYAGGDAEAAMEQMVAQMAVSSPRFAELLLDRRNTRWAARLAAPLREGGIFIAAGAGHMVGPRGLVALLRASGFTVQRIRAADTTSTRVQGH